MKPLTGPDGDNPITDAQIRELREQARNRKPHADFRLWTTCDDALERIAPRAASRARRLKKRNAARTRCAEAWNARMLPCRCHTWPRDRLMADGHRPDCAARKDSEIDRCLDHAHNARQGGS